MYMAGGPTTSMRHRTGTEYAYRTAVGGFLPGYAGHRPGNEKIVGNTSFGGVPFQRPVNRAPGQGFGTRLTTYHCETGRHYPKNMISNDEVFSSVKQVAGVKKPGPFGELGVSYGALPHDGFGRQPWDLIKSAIKRPLFVTDPVAFLNGKALTDKPTQLFSVDSTLAC